MQDSKSDSDGCDFSNAVNIEFKFENGLIPAIVQDAESKEVLMFAYMNEEAFRLTLETKIAHYWSRSRQSLWKKGETSGHYQHVINIFFDCDADCLLLFVRQDGGACHEGYRSCFYRSIDGEIVGEKVFDEKEVY
ncbi:Phosphoribosyl-AMP cyclohydrolase [Methanimicrococcus sp. At1]|uniref:Phosphoribosyl-AMP cyclohydrolase n=1 Tax=Methanimicrococcus hacksteinii TaxID=3028293 RepID=A0ABU3VQ10_9EURY|nr:phosphoribosyl-AMP cyclohydrolase [Methanimicrococcus sp. At1]MDV0445504.1 Phosphoribosyl-AMP cyclohydrolase [Methanimicrococcus sp. At1]